MCHAPCFATNCSCMPQSSLPLSLSTLSDCNGQFNYSQVVSHQILIYLQAATLEQRATQRERERERETGRQQLWQLQRICGKDNSMFELLSYLFNEIAFLSFQFPIQFDSIRFACCPSLTSFFSLFSAAAVAHIQLELPIYI